MILSLPFRLMNEDSGLCPHRSGDMIPLLFLAAGIYLFLLIGFKLEGKNSKKYLEKMFEGRRDEC